MERGYREDPATGTPLGITGKVGSDEPWEQSYIKEHHRRPYIHGPPNITVGKGPVDLPSIERQLRLAARRAAHRAMPVERSVAERHFMPHERFGADNDNSALVAGVVIMILGVISPFVVGAMKKE
jgi:hypothetical protein